MVLITGGKYQGKLDFVLQNGGYTYDDVFDFALINTIEYASMDYREKKVWYNLEEYVRSLTVIGITPEQIEKMVIDICDKYPPEAIIISEVGAGIIPMGKNENTFREVTGRVSVHLGQMAKEAFRITCGLQVRLK